MKKIMIIVGFALCGVACTKKEVKTKPTAPVVEVQKTLITPIFMAEGILSGAGDENVSEHYVIKNQVSWDSLVTKMNSVNNFYTPAAIDFSTHTVIAVFTDVKPTGGWSVAISQIEQTASNIMVTKVVTGPLDLATQALTQPFTIVKIPNSTLPILFN